MLTHVSSCVRIAMCHFNPWLREQAMIQDVVTVSELARTTGFSTLLFSGRSKESLKSDDAKRIMNLPSDYGFHVAYRMPQTP